MIHRLIWHGPVEDAEYDVEAETWDDAEAVLMAYLNGDDMEAGEVTPVSPKTVREG